MTAYWFVLALIAVVGGVAVAAAATVGVIVCWLVRALDRLVNGWQILRDDDGDDDGGEPSDPPEPPDGPRSAQDLPERPRHRTLRDLALSRPVAIDDGQVPRGPGGQPVVPAPATSPAAQRTAARLAANLRHLVGMEHAELLALYADPVPGHDRSCVCPGCVHRLVEWYAAAAAEAAIAHVQPRAPAAGPEDEAGRS